MGENVKAKSFVLKRRYFPDGTFSTLHRADGTQICVTVERPWLDNAPNVSCIPEGVYSVKKTVSPRFGEAYFLEGETVSLAGPSPRTHVLFHAANLAKELQGCIAPGLSFGALSGSWAVLSSKVALSALFREFDDAGVTLVIESNKL